MIDEKLVTYLESYLTKHRVMRFNEVLKNRTKHFTCIECDEKCSTKHDIFKK